MRAAILAELDLIASPTAQLAYEAELRGHAGHASTELISVFCDDLFHPRELARDGFFGNDELKDLAHLYGMMVEVGRAQHDSVATMLKDPAWRRVMLVAGEIRMRWGGMA